MRLKRSVAIIAAVALSFFAAVAPAHAATAEATKAAAWIVAFGTGQADDDTGAVADEVLALASTGDTTYNDAIYERLVYLKSHASAYTTGSPEAAAKLAIVAAATGQSATDFGGVNLIAKVTSGIGPDGSFGSWPGPFASGLGMVALARNGEVVPDAMFSYLLTYQSSDSGFNYTPGASEGDPDSTAMAILGLQSAHPSDSALGASSAMAALTAIQYLTASQRADGGWAAWSPVNSAGMAGPLLADTAKQKAKDYVASQQLASGGLKTGADGATTANAAATNQGIFALTNQTYLSISIAVTAPTAAPTTAPPTTSSPRATTPTATSADPATTSVPVATATSTTSSGDSLADTGSNIGAGLLALSFLAAASGTALIARRKTRR